MGIQLCLRCAREEYREDKDTCPCGGTLWHPQNVGGKPGNRDVDEAIRLIRQGQTPWERAD